MNPTAGSFIINPRLQRLFMTLTVDFPNQESLMKIYGTFVNGHLKSFNPDIQVMPCLSCNVVSLWQFCLVYSSCLSLDNVVWARHWELLLPLL